MRPRLVVEQLRTGVAVARALTRFPERPDRLPRALLALRPWGLTLPGMLAAGAVRHPDDAAIVDDAGHLTYRELWDRTRALAAALEQRGVGPGATVGVLARNHRGFVEAMVAVAALGADLVLLNTGFAGPQLADVAAAEGLDLLIHDDDLGEVAAAAPCDRMDATAADRLAGGPGGDRLTPPTRPGRLVVLTSGTTGRPKGAARRASGDLDGPAGLLGRIPLRMGDRTVVAAPLFHAWGLAQLLLGLSMGATIVLHRAFDPEQAVADVAGGAQVLVVVPVMLQRILALGDDVWGRYDTSSLRVIASSGSAVPGPVVTATLARFGPVLYNVYGSTEVSIASIATPDDLRRAPTTAGTPAPGVTVRILDDQGTPVATGAIGRIFVASGSPFDGYTDGSDKARQGSLVSSGDVGHVDLRGLLFVDGRADDMIVSGGENVFPAEVEEVLAAHPAIAEVAVVGVPDAEYGQALAAFVVAAPGATLDVEEVRAWVRDRLARFKVPRQVHLLDELPRNATGKVLRKALT